MHFSEANASVCSWKNTRNDVQSSIRNGRPAALGSLQCFLAHWCLRTVLAFGGPVFRGCGRPVGVSSPLQPLRGLRLRTVLAFGGPVFRGCGRPVGVSSPLQPLRGLRLRTVLAFGGPAFHGCALRTGPQFAIVDPHRTQSVLVALVAHWAYYGLFRALRADFVRPVISD